MIKLIASDIDGTLLHGDQTQLGTKMFNIIEKLYKKEILFCAASGRQYESLRRLFAPVSDMILYSCENGSIVYYKNKIIAKTSLSLEICEQLYSQILAQPGCEILISGANTSYVLPKSESYYNHIKNELCNNTVKINSLSDISEDIIKISAYTDKPAAEYEQTLACVWSKHLNVAIAGKNWLDFTLAHKGTALSQIGEKFSISSKEMLVFGDNFNDIPMFRFAGKSYAMNNAPAQVKAAADNVCESVEVELISTILS